MQRIMTPDERKKMLLYSLLNSPDAAKEIFSVLGFLNERDEAVICFRDGNFEFVNFECPLTLLSNQDFIKE